MCKPRHLKTLYERFSHHMVSDLNLIESETKQKLNAYFKEQDRREWRHKEPANNDVFKAMLELNISYCGKFYISGFSDGDKQPWSDADLFSRAFDKIVKNVKLKNSTSNMMEVQVIAADFKDAVLIIYKDASSYRFNTEIVRDKHAELLLEGNIAHMV